MQHAIAVAPPSRRRARLVALLTGALVALVAALAPAAQASVYQWTFDFPSGIAPSTNYSFSLYNEHIGDEVVYSDRGPYCTGINLGWSDGTTRQWRFRRTTGATGPLRYGERLALRNTKYMDYLHYGSRACGINLVWTDDPDYEWVIKGGPTGTAVTVEADNALYNLSEPDYLVYAWRPGDVINLRWWKDAEEWYCQYHNYC